VKQEGKPITPESTTRVNPKTETEGGESDTVPEGNPSPKVQQGMQRRSQINKAWPLHDIAITNIECCMAYKREVGRGGGVHCAIVVQ